MAETGKDAWMPIARTLRPQGRKGEVLAELLTDRVEEFHAGRSVGLCKPGVANGQAGNTHIIEDHWLPVGRNAGRIVLKFAGCDSISQAETLAGMEVLVPRSEMPELEPDTYYVEDLLGCALFDRELKVGAVVDVQFVTSSDGKVRLQDAAPLLAIDREQESAGTEGPVLVPFVRAYLKEVDVPGKRVLMELPEGLLDVPDGADAPSEPEGP